MSVDNLTHTLIGAALGQAGLKRATGLGMAALMIGANIPDLDAGCSIYGLESLAMRRGLTHGPIAMLVLPAALTGALLAFDRWQGRRGKRPSGRAVVRPAWLFLLALIGTLSHPFFDWLNSYGIRLLEPFSSQWFYGDSLFIIDPWIWLALGFGIWRSRRRERAAHMHWPRPALIACVAVAFYTLANLGITARAEHKAAALLAAAPGLDAQALVVVANPVPLAFWDRRILWRDDTRYGMGDSSLWGATMVDVKGLPLGLEHPGLADLPNTSAAARAFLFWSRMPVVTEQDGQARLGDQRFLDRFASGQFSLPIPPKANAAAPMTAPAAGPPGTAVNRLGDSLWYVFEDKQGRRWFGSDGEGVYRHDGKALVQFTTADGLCGNQIRQIQQDAQGHMFFSTLTGICKFDGTTFTTLKPIKSKAWKLAPNDMWFHMLGKKDEHGPYRYDGTNLYSLEFPKHYLHDEMLAGGINPFFSPYEVYSIYKDRRGAMWFGTAVFGAARFDGTSVKWMYERDLTIAPNGGTFGIRSIFEDRAGRFWLCNTQHRYVFDMAATAKTDRLVYQKVKGIGDAASFAGEPHVYYSHIVEDNNGAIWLTTWAQGVYKYDGNVITHYPVMDGAAAVNLVSMYKDPRGDLWLGTAKHGAYKFNGDTFVRFAP